MDKYLNKIAAFLVNNEKSKKLNLELYKYALKLIAHAFINIISTVVIGLFFNMLIECLSFYATFFILRKFTGGLHFQKYLYCLLSSLLIIILTLWIIKEVNYKEYQKHIIVMMFVSTFIILVFSPVRNNNKKISKKEHRIFWIASGALSVTVLVISIILMNNNSVMGISYAMGLIIDALLIILVQFINLINLIKYNCDLYIINKI